MSIPDNAVSRDSRPGWQRSLVWIKVAISIGLLWFLFARYDIVEAARRLTAIEPVWLGLVALIYAVMVLLATIRWQIVLRALAETLALPTAIAMILIGNFFNQILPSNVGGDAVRIWRLHQRGSHLGRSVGSVMLDRIVAIIALALLVLATVPLATRIIRDDVILTFFGIFIVAVFGGLAMLLWLDRAIYFVHRILPDRVTAAISALARDARTVLLKPSHTVRVILLALINHLLVIFMLMALAHGIGVEARFGDFLVLIPPVLAASVLPISFAGWGVREGAMIAMLGAVGIGANEALSLSVAMGLVAMVGSLPGGAIWLVTGNRTRR